MSDALLAYHRLSAASARYAKSYAALDDEERAEVDAIAARAFLIEEAVLSSREAEDVFAESDEIDAACNTIRNRYSDQNAFIEDLDRNGLCEAVLKAALGRELTVEAVLAFQRAMVPAPSEVELLAWYDAHCERFAVPETRSVSQILVTINDDYPESTRPAALKRINDIKVLLEQQPHAFEALAKRYSECPSAMEGGQLGRAPRGHLYPELDLALFALLTGGISNVVETEIGFHLIRCDAIHPARTVGFTEARQQILDAMLAKRRKRAEAVWLTSLLAQRTERGGAEKEQDKTDGSKTEKVYLHGNA